MSGEAHGCSTAYSTFLVIFPPSLRLHRHLELTALAQCYQALYVSYEHAPIYLFSTTKLSLCCLFSSLVSHLYAILLLRTNQLLNLRHFSIVDF
jgi:hypothetical protein